jgi:hypothetical protein
MVPCKGVRFQTSRLSVTALLSHSKHDMSSAISIDVSDKVKLMSSNPAVLHVFQEFKEKDGMQGVAVGAGKADVFVGVRSAMGVDDDNDDDDGTASGDLIELNHPNIDVNKLSIIVSDTDTVSVTKLLVIPFTSVEWLKENNMKYSILSDTAGESYASGGSILHNHQMIQPRMRLVQKLMGRGDVASVLTYAEVRFIHSFIHFLNAYIFYRIWNLF